ncbi:MAG: hypothetical protein GXX79_14180 [Actinomycetales bacterium]|nr:hypothetical protein [Actinomycetales bacterium]
MVAHTWYHRLVIRHLLPGDVARAGLALGTTLSARGDMDGACAAFQSAIDSRDIRYWPQAAVAMGDLLRAHGDTNAAAAAYRTLTEFREEEISSDEGLTLYEYLNDQAGDEPTGRPDFAGARARALRRAVSATDPNTASIAALLLGCELAGHDMAGSRDAFRTYCDIESVDMAVVTLVCFLGYEIGDLEGTRLLLERLLEFSQGTDAELVHTELRVLAEIDGDVAAYREIQDQRGYGPAHP